MIGGTFIGRPGDRLRLAQRGRARRLQLGDLAGDRPLPCLDQGTLGLELGQLLLGCELLSGGKMMGAVTQPMILPPDRTWRTAVTQSPWV